MARASATDDELGSLSSMELAELLTRVEAAIIERQKSSRVEIKGKIVALATEAGFTVEELFGARQGKAPRAAVAVKYRNPEDASETWSGRGRMAKWLAEKIKKRGTKIEDFAV